MHAREHRTRIRGAAARGEVESLVGYLTEDKWPEDALQLIGDGLLTALAVLPRRTEAVDQLATECIRALHDRGWEGDAELVDQLRGALGGPMPLLRPVNIDLEELGAVLEGDPAHGGGRVDLLTGAVWPQFALDYADELDDDDDDSDGADEPARWLWVECEGSRPGYRDMELFIADLGDPEAANQLSIAIDGRGAFRRFKDVLERWPDLVDRWLGFSEDRRRGRARAWLADAGYTTAPIRLDG